MCQQAYEQGARFAKWRNVLQLDPAKQMPTELAIADCVHTLARYASIAQSEGMDTLADHFCFFLKRGCMLGVAAFFYKNSFLAQSEGLVPIVEPEIVPNGHSLPRSWGWGLGAWGNTTWSSSNDTLYISLYYFTQIIRYTCILCSPELGLVTEAIMTSITAPK